MDPSPKIIDIAERIAEHFPLGGEPFSLEVVPGATGSWVRAIEPTAVATIRSITWDVDPATGTMSIRDIKEQDVAMGWPVYYDDAERVAAYFQALSRVIVDLGKLDRDETDGYMPADLMHPEVLALRRARTVADFEAALRVKSRLGALLK